MIIKSTTNNDICEEKKYICIPLIQDDDYIYVENHGENIDVDIFYCKSVELENDVACITLTDDLILELPFTKYQHSTLNNKPCIIAEIECVHNSVVYNVNFNFIIDNITHNEILLSNKTINILKGIEDGYRKYN